MREPVEIKTTAFDNELSFTIRKFEDDSWDYHLPTTCFEKLLDAYRNKDAEAFLVNIKKVYDHIKTLESLYDCEFWMCRIRDLNTDYDFDVKKLSIEEHNLFNDEELLLSIYGFKTITEDIEIPF